MILDKLIKKLSDYLEVSSNELSEDSNIFDEYDLDDDDILKIIKLFEDTFDIDIDKDEILELNTLEEFAEYIESLF